MSSEMATGAVPAPGRFSFAPPKGRATTVAAWAATIGGLGWITKILIMWGQGGPDTDSIPEALAFFTGLIGISLAGAAFGWAGAAALSTPWRVLALVAGIMVPLLIGLAAQVSLGALLPDAGWFRDESVFLVLGVVALLLGGRAIIRSRQAR